MTSKEEILKVAAALIREKGYAGLSMRDLAQTIGVKASSLYNHIPSKQAILKEIILELAKDFIAQIEGVIKNETVCVDRLKQIISHHVDLSLHHPNELGVLNNEWIHLEGDSKLYFKEMRRAYEEKLRSIIHEGKAQGELKNLHTELMLFSMLSTLRNLNLWTRKRGILEAAPLKAELIEVLLSGILRM